MGQRANYVIVEPGGAWTLFYSHWAANTIDRDLFWGPEHALAFVRGQKATDEWLDDAWCEGGALLDLSRRELIFFGGEDIRYDVIRHRVALAAMRVVWTGWTVRWAFEGLGDVVDHLGLSRELVRSGRPARDVRLDAATFEGEWPRSVVSVRRSDGSLALATSAVDAGQLAWAAAEVALVVPPGRAQIALSLRGDDATSGGVHIDVADRRVDLWTGSYEPDIFLTMEQRCPGWHLVHHGPEFEAHAALTEGALRFASAHQREVIDELAQFLLRDSTFDPAELLATIARHERAGADLQVNHAFFEYHPRALPEGERKAVVASVLANLPLQPGLDAP